MKLTKFRNKNKQKVLRFIAESENEQKIIEEFLKSDYYLQQITQRYDDKYPCEVRFLTETK